MHVNPRPRGPIPMEPLRLAAGTPLLRLALGLALLLLASACVSNAPDKRLLQYLNTSGFGNRYTGNAEEQNYVTLGDQVAITDEIHPELTTTEVVDVDGTIVLPEIGAVHVAGMTRSELEAFLTQKYTPYYDAMAIKVKLRTTGKVFFVFGEVTTEGVKPFPGDITVFEAVMAAAPNPRSANLGRVRVIRGDPLDPLIIHVPLTDIIDSGDTTFNVQLQERDIVYVPPTMLAQLGYFLSNLIYPVTQVIGQLAGSLYFFLPRNNYNSGAFGNTVF